MNTRSLDAGLIYGLERGRHAEDSIICKIQPQHDDISCPVTLCDVNRPLGFRA